MKSIDTPTPLAPPPMGQAKTSFSSLLAEFQSLRGQIGSLFALAGVDPTKTREPARDLGISRGLAWRLTRIVRESDPTPAVTDLPGPASMTKFFDACRARAVPEEAIAKAAAAFERFESVLSSCTGDRKTLAMMMVNRSPVNAGNEASKARRQLFDGACGVWGVQAQTRFVSVFVFPSPDDPDMLNAGHVTGFVGFRRLSPKPWPLSYEALHTATGDAAKLLKTPLDPEGADEGQLQLIKRFCTPSLPDIRVVESGSYKRFELAAGPVGNEGLTTCVFGTHLRHIYPRYSETPDTAGFMVLLTTPVERVMFDMYVHRSMNMEAPPPAQLLDRLAFPHASPESDFARQSLPIAEAPTLLPAGIEGTLAPSIPWYTNLVEDVTTRLGVPITDFVGSRFEMSFPPIATTLSRRFDLRPKP
ncbi:MAG: hypothetical protein IT434_10885 [Phycisphaerales bacterium]|nr:hypothetical protein [Phycisphaerales bacterium]